jgi:uncharacterized membrane protein YeaQ/YmgE (transglycosylase-associated protein family)
MDWVWFLVIGAAAGWLGSKLTGRAGYGLAGNLLLGVLGAIVGGFLLELIGFRGQGLFAKLLTATIGAVILISISSWLSKRQKE